MRYFFKKIIPFPTLFYMPRKMYMLSKKIRTSILTDETYYRMSERAYNYNYDYLKRKLENND